MNAPPKIHPLEAAALAALFAIAITLPLVKQLTVGEPDTTAIEKRQLAVWPDFVADVKWNIRYVPQQLDGWCNDHFGFRSYLLEANSLINFKLLYVSKRAIIGKNGWLFYKLDPPLFAQSLSDGDLARWKSYLEHRQQWLAARGVKYLFVVPPDKDSIYPEFLPRTSGPQLAELPVDQLVRYLRETHSSVDILSLREALLAAKKLEKEPLFYKQDTHWNSIGGFYGYEAIIQHLATELPGLKAKSRADYRLVSWRNTPRDIADMTGLPNFTAVPGFELQPLAAPSAQQLTLNIPGFYTPPFMAQMQNLGNRPTAIIMRDSFIIALAPYLSESFSRITCFQPMYNSLEGEKTIAAMIQKEKPDIFIEERLQRSIIGVPDNGIVFGDGENPVPNAKNP